MQRSHINIERRKGTSVPNIAEALVRHHSMIYRKIKRNAGQRGYRYKQAHEQAMNKRNVKPKAIKITNDIMQIIRHLIKQGWSLGQVTDRPKKIWRISLNHETTYRYLLKNKVRWWSAV